MAEQLIFTSAPSGLKPGTRGYTTVAASRGISPPMMAKLEGMSGYRLAFNVSDARAEQNPVAYSHQLLRQGGQTLSLLSRVAACGVDYSGRSNFLAHHLMLGASERPSAGPAWLLQQSQVLRDAWEDQPGYLDDAIALPNGAVEPSSCSTWERVAGDAGWAGELLKKMKDAPRSPLFVVYPLGTDVLALFAEAIALLPASRRWQATFNTYYNTSAPESVCLWRGVLADSPAAKEAARARGASVIDLTSRLDPAPASDFATAARSGESVSDLFVIRQKQATSGVSQEANEIGIVEDKADAEFFDESNDYDLEVLGQDDTPEGSRRTSERQNRSRMVVSAAPPRRRRNSHFAKIAIVSGVMLIAISLCAWILISNSRYENQVKEHEARLRELIFNEDFYAARDEVDQILELSPDIFSDPRITSLATDASEGIAKHEKVFQDKRIAIKELVKSNVTSNYDQMEREVESLEKIALTDHQKNVVKQMKGEFSRLRDVAAALKKAEMTKRIIALQQKLKESDPEKGKDPFIREIVVRREALEDEVARIQGDASLTRDDRRDFLTAAKKLIDKAVMREASLAKQMAAATPELIPTEPKPVDPPKENTEAPTPLEIAIEGVNSFKKPKPTRRIFVAAGVTVVSSKIGGDTIKVADQKKDYLTVSDDQKLLIVTKPGGKDFTDNKPVPVGSIAIARKPTGSGGDLLIEFEPAGDFQPDQDPVEIVLLDSVTGHHIALVLPYVKNELFEIINTKKVIEGIAPAGWTPVDKWQPHDNGSYIYRHGHVQMTIDREKGDRSCAVTIALPELTKLDEEIVDVKRQIALAKPEKPSGVTFEAWNQALDRDIKSRQKEKSDLEHAIKKRRGKPKQADAIARDRNQIDAINIEIKDFQKKKAISELPNKRTALESKRKQLLADILKIGAIEVNLSSPSKSGICHKLRVILIGP